MPAYDVTKLQYYKTVVYIAFTITTFKLKYASHYILWKAFFNNFSIIENFESIQTVHDKWKYKLQQLFKMLSLSLDRGPGLESFSPLLNGPVNDGQFGVSPHLNRLLLQFSQVAYWLLVYVLLHASRDLSLIHIWRCRRRG